MVNTIKSVKDFLKGKKTYIVGFLSIALGVLNKNPELIVIGLAAFSIRAGISNEIAKALTE